MTPTMDPRSEIDDVAQQLFSDQLEARPLQAAQLGYQEYLGQLPDLTSDGRGRRRQRLMALGARAEAVALSGLDPERRITRSMALQRVADEVGALDASPERYTVTPIPQTGLAARLLVLLPKSLLRDAQDVEAYLRACAGIPQWLGEAQGLLASGATAGLAPVRRLVAKAAAQIEAYLELPLDDDPFLSVPLPPAGAGRRDELAAVVRHRVRPALEAYRRHLRQQVLPGARPDAKAGLCHLPGGEQEYQRLVTQHTTTHLTTEEIHRIGLDLVEQLTEEFSQLGEKVLGSYEFEELTARLRSDQDLFFTSGEEILEAASRSMARAEVALPAWLGRLPQATCQVLPVPPLETENGDLGHYQRPSHDGTRPGTYWVNTANPRTRPRFESEALAFHESVPGHHTQLALAQELQGQSQFRRHASVTAFQEGWALYVERLADQMGLYSGDLYRLGMLSFDFWRACRLVVDTGMHAMGWGRDQAVRYMLDHSALTPKNVENEVDRYIGWPGQALGYMVGRLEIRRLRERCERELGPRFSLRGFHDELIGHGALPLSVLDGVISGWAERQSSPGRPDQSHS
jgi:uncharacterized protein (DUF885 family)